MADSFLAYQNPTTTDKKLDSESLAVGANTVERERVQIAGAGATDIAPVSPTAGLKVDLGADNDVAVTSSALPTGAATSAKQDTIISHVDGIEAILTTVDADTGNISTKIDTLAGAVSGTEIQADVLTVPADPFGANADAAATAGSTGSMQSKLRLMTSQLDSIKTAVETIDNTVAGSELQVDVLTMPTTTVQATNLDIRDLTATDKVTIANIEDGAGDSVMDATNNAIKVNVVAGGAGDGAILDGVSSAIKATVLDYANSNPVAVRLTDTSGDYIAAGAGTQYTEGDTDATITGTASLMEGAGNALVPLQGTAADGLLVNLGTNNDVTVSGVSTAANQSTIIGHLDGVEGLLTTIDGDTGNISTKIDTLAGAVSGTEVQVDVLTMPTTTVQATNLDIRDLTQASDNVRVYANTAKDGSGTGYVPLVDTDGHLQVDVLTGGGAGTQYTEDDAAAANPVGTMAMAVRADSLGAVTTTDGDNVALRSTNKGELYVKQTDAVPVTDNGGALTVDNGGTFAVQAAQSGTWNVTNVSGTVSLPTGASTLAEQQTQTTSLQLIDDGVATVASAITSKGMAAVGTDGTNARILKTDTSGELQVDVLTLPSNASVNVAQINGVATTMGNGVAGTGVQRVTIASDSTGNIATIGTSVTPGTAAANLGKAEDAAHSSGDVGVMSLAVSNEANTARAADGDYVPFATDTEGNTRVVGNRDHDAVDAGEIVGVGGRAIAHGSNPTAVAAADRTAWYFNRAGVPFVIGGHPNIVNKHIQVTDADGAQTDTALVTVGAGTKIVVTRYSVAVDAATTATGGVAVRMGFGTANTPANDANTGMLMAHSGIPAGGGIAEGDGSGIIGMGADNEDLRLTCEDPAGGNIDIVVSYYTIES